MTEGLPPGAAAPPLLTAGLPGTGGTIKRDPEDFEVEEIPLYPTAGTGEFLYLFVQKRDVGAELFPKLIAGRLGVKVGDVGVAGLKDRRAVTRQWVSVPESAEGRLSQLGGDGLTLLETTRHTNKLKSGHLAGNRFRILIRDIDPSADVAAKLGLIASRGLPNFFGGQRFGQDGRTAIDGLRWVRREAEPKRNPFIKKLGLSAAQSVLFNVYLARRMADGLYRTVLPGDVMQKLTGGMFVAEDVAAEQPRFDGRETVHAGPMFGRKTFAAAADAAEREAAVLSEAGLTRESFAGFGKLLAGTRRANLVYPDGLEWGVTPDGLRLSFGLPSGSYATNLLREVME